MSPQQDLLKKRLDRIQEITALSVLGLLCWLLWLSKIDKAAVNMGFWFTLSIFVLFMMDGVFSIKRGHGWAKGLKIDKEVTPIIFIVNLLFSFLMASVGLFGAIYYW